MKNRFLFLSLITVLVLTSCQNFLTSSELKEAIEKEILIANSNIPEILSAEPKLTDGGVYSDSNIIVSFSKPMDSKYLSDFSNITITDSNGTNLASHYLSPVLSSDGRTLTVAHDPSNYITVEEGSLKTVKVTLSKNIQDAETIPLKNDYTWTYNINSKKDDKAPEFLSGTTLKGSSAPMQEGTFANLITTLGADNFFTDTYHVNSVKITIEAYDSGSGISKISIKEKLLFSTEGLDVRNSNFETITEINDFESTNNKISYSGDYIFSKDLADGIIQLTLKIEDLCGNTQEKTFAMIKDTEAKASCVYKFADDANPNVSKQESNKYFKIENITTSGLWAKYNNIEYKDIISIAKINLLNHEEEFIEEGVETGNGLYKFDSISNKYDYYLQILLKDKTGNIFEKRITLRKAPVRIEQWKMSGKYYVNLSIQKKCECYIDNSNVPTKDYSYSIPIEINQTAFYRIDYSDSSNYEIDTFGFYSDVYTFSDNGLSSLGDPDISNFVCNIIPRENVKEKGFVLRFSLKNNYLQDFTDKYVIIGVDVDNSSNRRFYAMEGNQVEIPLSVTDTYFYLSYSDYLYIGLLAYNESQITNSKINELGALKKESGWHEINFKEIVNSADDIYIPYVGSFYFSSSSQNNEPFINAQIFDNYNSPNISHMLNQENKLPVKLYWGKKTNRELTEKEIKLLNCVELTAKVIDVAKGKIEIPICNILQKTATMGIQDFEIYLYLEDDANNYSFKKMSYKNTTDYQITYNGSNIEYSFINDETSYNTYTYIANTTINNISNSDHESSTKSLKLPASIPSEGSFLVSFIKNKDNLNYYPIYLYSKKLVCNTKNIIQNAKILTIVHNQPVLVHTVTSPVNFGDDIRAWENWTGLDNKLNETVITADGSSVKFDNYDYPSASDIPSGWYYAAIIYFADNTSTIGTVFQN